MDADVGGDASQHDVVDAAQAQQQLEIGGAERALAGLVDDGLVRFGIKIGDDVPARLAAHQNAAAGAGVADIRTNAPRPPTLVTWEIGKIRAVSFARVKDVETVTPHRSKPAAIGLIGARLNDKS